jgi:hypothetical protein
MYKTSTVFIVGAGASFEIGMPTGVALRDTIRQQVDISFEFGNRPISGSPRIARALETKIPLSINANVDEYNKYLVAGRHISRALGQAISIDNFVENLEDEKIETMAKLAIAEAILIAEENSILHKQIDERGRESFLWDKLEKTWYHTFFQTIVEGRKKSNIEDIFDNISIITFNYDRSIEYYLKSALENYYAVEASFAASMVNRLTIYHPYGVVGKLPWQAGSAVTADFGGSGTSQLYEISTSIKTFSEQTSDEVVLEKMRAVISECEQLVFLGFAFHDANMDLLQPTTPTKAIRVIGTAKGISNSDISVIKRRIENLVSSIAKNSGAIEIVKELVCSQLFYDYSRTLRS